MTSEAARSSEDEWNSRLRGLRNARWLRGLGFGSRRLNVIFAAVLAVVGLSYFFFSSHGFSNLLTPKTAVTNYQKLADAFLHGQSYLLEAPNRALLALPDPYDPDRNRPFKINDMSLYDGHYYLYFGPVPALFFYAPLAAVTGYFPADGTAVAIFLLGGFGFLFAVFLLVVRDYFRETPLAWVLCLGALLAYGTMAPYFLARPEMYEVAIASAQLWLGLAVLIFYLLLRRSEYSARRRALLGAGLGLALVLATGSRPHFALLCMAANVFFFLRRRQDGNGVFRGLLACSAVGGIMLALYNYLRFGNFLEFGLSYQLMWFQHPKMLAPFNARSLLFNFVRGTWFYLLRQPTFFGSFPYLNADLTTAAVGRASLEDYGREATVGLFAMTPMLIFTTPALVASLRGASFWKSEKLELVGFLKAISVAAGTLMLIILSFRGATQRYTIDFASLLMLASALTWLAVDDALSGPAWSAISLRGLWRGLTGMLALAGLLGQLLLGFTGQYHSFGHSNPQLMATLSAFLPKFNL